MAAAIIIRAARPDDAASIAAFYAPHVLHGTASFEDEAPDAAGMQARMAASDGLYPWLVATLDDAPGKDGGDGGSGGGGNSGGDVLAFAYATRFRDRAAYRFVCETTVYVADGAQRQGAGRLVYEALVDTLRAQGFTQAIGVIALPNDGSIRLHEAVGFRRAGVYREVGYKAGQWVDVGHWQCQLAHPAVPPVEPRRFADLGVVRG